MRNFIVLLCVCSSLLFCTPGLYAESSPQGDEAAKVTAGETQEATEMLTSLLDLQKSLREQIVISKKKYKYSKSEAEKASLEEEIANLDKQISDTANDFERIATGVEPALFAEKKPETFSWKEELASLVEPAIKELKRFTVRARQKTRLKDSIAELKLLSVTASQAVEQLQQLEQETKGKPVHKDVKALLPEWLNIDKRLQNKLELAERELAQLEENDSSLLDNSRKSIKTFFRDRGLYLILAIIIFVAILLGCRLLHYLVGSLLGKMNSKNKQRSFQVRLLDILFKVLSVVLAVIGFFFVLYLAEDWFLLSIAIILSVGMVWTVRQGVPRLWQQGRLMLNIGSIREKERLILHGVPWHVTSINVFCRLVNPSLGIEIRIPIEDLVGLSSRPYRSDEPWFPCKKGDWVVVGTASRAKVVSLSHEQVEVVQRGGKRIVYPTDIFLQSCPVNLSRNFRMRIPFGISYALQEQATSTVPATLKSFLERKMEEAGYMESCLNLLVEFYQANASSLDLIVLADFDGNVADICKRIERAVQKWCVECCTENGWEIPFPQLTIHQPEQQSNETAV